MEDLFNFDPNIKGNKRFSPFIKGNNLSLLSKNIKKRWKKDIWISYWPTFTEFSNRTGSKQNHFFVAISLDFHWETIFMPHHKIKKKENLTQKNIYIYRPSTIIIYQFWKLEINK